MLLPIYSDAKYSLDAVVMECVKSSQVPGHNLTLMVIHASLCHKKNNDCTAFDIGLMKLLGIQLSLTTPHHLQV